MSLELEVFDTGEAFRASLDRSRARGLRVALVPTMGALHRGHLALVAEARRRVGETGIVAVSIFVNPTQFGKNEDYSRYPRTLESDLAKCRAAGVNIVFAPSVEEMYPPGSDTRVHVGPLAEPLCGEHRPGHFEGVATIVAKLFALTGPSVAVFGKKDYQQLRVITRMAQDLRFPVEVVPYPTVREEDGVALSSRNAYLSEGERARARAIPRALAATALAFGEGERDPLRLRAIAHQIVEPVADSIDYVSIVDAETLAPFAAGSKVKDRALLAIALRIGSTRLIDNLVLGEDAPPTSVRG